MVNPNPKDIEARFQQIEKELKWWKMSASSFSLIVVLLVLFGARASTVPDEIRAKRFIIVGPNGRNVGEFAAKQGSSLLTLSDPKGETRLLLHHSYDTPSGLVISDGKQMRAELSLRLDDSTALDLFDKQGKIRASIAVSADGTVEFSK